jgi:hypothetical protein
MNGEGKSLKFYQVSLVGIPKTDAAGVPVKDEAGNLIPEFVHVANPAAEVVAAIGRGRFYQATMIELAEGDPIKNLGGKSVEIGPMAGRGKAVNVFEGGRHREVFKAIAEKVAANQVKILVPFTTKTVAGGKTQTTCVGVIENWALPGLHIISDCGFDHYLYQRDPLTHKVEKRYTPGWDDNGKWDTKKCTTINWVDVFLYANEIDAADAFIKAEMAIAAKFKPLTGDTNQVPMGG